MIKLFGYELRRLLFNKFFMGLLVITGLYSYQVLSGDIIVGVANTAPFSRWSYGAFLSAVLPLLLITLLFFTTFLYSKKEKQVGAITFATPIDPLHYGFLRCLAMVTGFVVISGIAIGLSLIFYARVFHFTAFGDFLVPIVLTLIPAMLFTLGVGLTAGRVHLGLLYALMLILLLLGQMPLPYSVDLLGGNFFHGFPATLPVGLGGEVVFTIPMAVWIGKAVYSIVGLALTLLWLIRLRERHS